MNMEMEIDKYLAVMVPDKPGLFIVRTEEGCGYGGFTQNFRNTMWEVCDELENETSSHAELQAKFHDGTNVKFIVVAVCPDHVSNPTLWAKSKLVGDYPDLKHDVTLN